MQEPAQIVVDNISHLYRPPRGREVLALDAVSLEVRQSEFIALLGPSGCGKSTLLYLIGGFLPVEKGEIRVDGKAVAGPGPDRGIVFQHFALFPWKTVRGNVLYGLERQGMAKAEREKRAMDYIELVGLHGFEAAGQVGVFRDETADAVVVGLYALVAPFEGAFQFGESHDHGFHLGGGVFALLRDG